MSDDPTQHAIDVVAHHMVATGAHADDDCWRLYYRKIGPEDWPKVLARADQIVAHLEPNRWTFDAAYEHLAQRAEDPA
jgi:hypothetical protein